MRAQRPFDTRAMASADDAFYRAHPELAPGGKRVPLAAGDPRTDEWLCLYQAYGGKLAADPPGQKPVGGAKQLCQKVKARLRVELSYLPLPAPVAGATVTLAGPESRTGKSDARGVVEFADLAPGDYQVQAVLNSGNAMVDAARPMAGSSTWEYGSAKGPYPANTNKCNLFVYDIAGMAGIPVPMLSRFSVSQFKHVSYPPLAGQWADAAVSIPGWAVVASPLPGDTIAEKHLYADASGHVGIVSYPQDAMAAVTLAPGDSKTTPLNMQRQTLSQSANTDVVVENDWGWRAGQSPVFRRYTP